jgi:hypothetical protein
VEATRRAWWPAPHALKPNGATLFDRPEAPACARAAAARSAAPRG